MRIQLVRAFFLSFLLVSTGYAKSSRGVPAPPALNSDGSYVTGVITARFDPTTAVIPFPSNLLLSGTKDLTLNAPTKNPNNYGDPLVALNALDGFSTTAHWATTFSVAPKPSSILPGQTVRMFEVNLTGPGGGVTKVVRELSDKEFTTVLASSDTSGKTLYILPTVPLKQLTSYMAVLLGNGGRDLQPSHGQRSITDMQGNDVTADQTYFLTKRTKPLCVKGVSTEPLLPATSACSLEPLRQLINSQEAAVQQAGVDPSRIVLSWVATTQSITPVIQLMVERIEKLPPPETQLAATGMDIGKLGLGLPPVADILVGTVTLPYYLSAPSAQNPTAVLTGFWQAAPGAYRAPFDKLGLDPTSTHITYANPLPVATSQQTIPLLMTIPNTASGKTKPANGWPTVIFQHGITRNRTDMFSVSATLAAQGFAVVAIDIPLHGITDTSSPFYVKNTSFASKAIERTFDIDLTNNATGAAGPDGKIDPTGSLFINLSSLLTSRDNVRQPIVDLAGLTRAIPFMSYSGKPDFDGSRIQFVGQSLGAMVGTPFVGTSPHVKTAVLSVPGGGIAGLAYGSPTFGPQVRAGLAAVGILPGTSSFDQFFLLAQTMDDSGDPINYGPLNLQKNILLHEVVGGGDVIPDQVIPNTIPGAPLAGTEPLIRALELPSLTTSTQSKEGVRGAVRFTQGNHGSLLNPSASPAATMEMQSQMVSMLVSDGQTVQITNTTVLRTQ